MTKAELEKKVSDLEEELHISNNSEEYWSNESEMYRNKFIDLQASLEDNKLYQLTKKLSLNEAMQIEDFIKNLSYKPNN